MSFNQNRFRLFAGSRAPSLGGRFRLLCAIFQALCPFSTSLYGSKLRQTVHNHPFALRESLQLGLNHLTHDFLQTTQIVVGEFLGSEDIPVLLAASVSGCENDVLSSWSPCRACVTQSKASRRNASYRMRFKTASTRYGQVFCNEDLSERCTDFSPHPSYILGDDSGPDGIGLSQGV